MKINQKEGQDKLPSFFETLNTTINRPLESLQKLEEFITTDVYTQQNTEGYRIDAKIDRKLAMSRKQRSHGICPSIQFMRTGKSWKTSDGKPSGSCWTMTTSHRNRWNWQWRR